VHAACGQALREKPDSSGFHGVRNTWPLPASNLCVNVLDVKIRGARIVRFNEQTARHQRYLKPDDSCISIAMWFDSAAML
jgi:hypothetical protein